MVVGSDTDTGVPTGVVAVRVREVTVPVLTVLSSAGSADPTSV